jgi:hypothetical protein
MNAEYRQALARLAALGWRVDSAPAPGPLPGAVASRYPWIPASHREFIQETRCAVSPEEKAWLLTAADFSMESETPYAWNEWERQSLDAAGSDEDWKQEIEAFWDDHCPILISVKSGYAYFAIERGSLRVVRGEEPEFEETAPVASSVLDFLQRIAASDPGLVRWI